MEGFVRWPRLDVVWRGACPIIMSWALIRRKASMTTCVRTRPCRYRAPLSTARRASDLALDTLDGIDDNGDGALVQLLEALRARAVEPLRRSAPIRHRAQGTVPAGC
jgi:hypothetical protein